jgi:hypothetical protein
MYSQGHFSGQVPGFPAQMPMQKERHTVRPERSVQKVCLLPVPVQVRYLPAEQELPEQVQSQRRMLPAQTAEVPGVCLLQVLPELRKQVRLPLEPQELLLQLEPVLPELLRRLRPSAGQALLPVQGPVQVLQRPERPELLVLPEQLLPERPERQKPQQVHPKQARPELRPVQELPRPGPVPGPVRRQSQV